MSQVTVTLPDGSSRSVPAGTPVRDVAGQISPGLARAALAGFVDGKMVDLSYPVDHDAAIRIVTDRSPEALALARHSTAHLMAAAVTQLFPGTQYAQIAQLKLDQLHGKPTRQTEFKKAP